MPVDERDRLADFAAEIDRIGVVHHRQLAELLVAGRRHDEALQLAGAIPFVEFAVDHHRAGHGHGEHPRVKAVAVFLRQGLAGHGGPQGQER